MSYESEASQPVFSIIIPTRDRAGMLARTLESLAGVVDPGDPIEVIVVDNGSNDATAGVCKAIGERFPYHDWRYYYDAMPGLLTGRHRGAKEARGEILCYLDDDVLLEPSWMGAIKEAFQDPGVVITGGPSRPLYEVTPPTWLEGLWNEHDGGRMLTSLSLIDYGARRFIEPWYVWGLNFSIRKEVLYGCGGFHPDGLPSHLLRYRGDGETGLAFNIKKSGLQALYHPNAAVTHLIPASRLTVKAFEQRAFNQGISDSYTSIRRDGIVPSTPHQRSWRPLLSPMKVTLKREWILRNPTSDGIRALMYHAHAAGVDFHQNQVRHDPTLFEWVTKPDYFDYSLPSGCLGATTVLPPSIFSRGTSP